MQGRIRGLDELRGFALLGISIVNLPLLARSWESFYQPPQSIAAQWGIFFNSGFFDGKIFPIFAFLFGISLFLIGETAGTRVLVRRLFFLLLIGIAHGILLFPGDILVSYALLGFIFLFLRHRSDRTLFVVAVVCILAAAVAYFVMGRMAEVVPEIPRTNYLGAYTTAVRSNLAVYPLSLGFVGLFNVPTALAMFCLGYVSFRSGAFAGLRFTGKTFFFLIPGLAGSLYYGAATALHQKHLMAWAMVALAVCAPLLSAAYVQIFLSVVRSGRVAWLVQMFAVTGRMSLTNYLLQSVIAGLLFHGYGLALYGRISPAGLIGVSAGIFIFEVLFSAAWLKFFQCGPAEWVLRSFSHWRRQPLRN